jgi:hypothetical protein
VPRADGAVDLLVNLVVIALLPAIGEELMFRGVVQRVMTGLFRNVHAGVVLTAVVFSAIHVQFFGFFPRMLLGVYLGYLLLWSGTIWMPVAAHFLNNAAAVIAAYLVDSGRLPVDPDRIGLGEGSESLVILSVVLTAGLVWRLFRLEKEGRAGTSRQEAAAGGS